MTSDFAPPVVEGRWLQPSTSHPAEPRWGHPDGLQVGLWPIQGPRGLLRVDAPYLGRVGRSLINYIAVEPQPVGADDRGYSELEPSDLDPGAAGKRFWSADASSPSTPVEPTVPARGVVEVLDGVETLTVHVGVERFDNGAHVWLRLRFRVDRPHEIAIAGFAHNDSVPLEHLIVSATMGNYARLRQLHLADSVVTPAQLWPGFSGIHFTERTPVARHLLSTDGSAVVVTATPDETDMEAAVYAADTKANWKYSGLRAVQGWRVDAPHEELIAQVNGRWAYWASESMIPGGVSFENLEIVEPFRQGAEFRFFVDPLD